MADYTPRLGLIKPTPDEMVDIESQINANMDALDKHSGFMECTSTTRPANPFPGMAIFETDTGRYLIWGLSDWKTIQIVEDYERHQIQTPAGFTGAIHWSRSGRIFSIDYDLEGTTNGGVIGYIPPGYAPRQSVPATEYYFAFQGSARPAFLVNNAINLPAQPGVSRRLGTIMFIK